MRGQLAAWAGAGAPGVRLCACVAEWAPCRCCCGARLPERGEAVVPARQPLGAQPLRAPLRRGWAAQLLRRRHAPQRALGRLTIWSFTVQFHTLAVTFSLGLGLGCTCLGADGHAIGEIEFCGLCEEMGICAQERGL